MKVHLEVSEINSRTQNHPVVVPCDVTVSPSSETV